LGDPTETAILAAGAKIGIDRDTLSAWPRLAELPFDAVRKRRTTIQEIDGEAVACVKGAWSELLPRCATISWNGSSAPLDEQLTRATLESHDQLTGHGMRVLAVAARRLDPQMRHNPHWRAEEVETGLLLLGLIAMEDPPRAEVPTAIAGCRQAGIKVVMVTGDDGGTAAAIGREIGLLTTDCTIVTCAPQKHSFRP